MIVILMKYHGHTLQSAVDFVGDLCELTIDQFIENRKYLPSWGPEVDGMVDGYVQGLQDWITGSLHWSFMTKRYFQDNGAEVKRTRFVPLLPKESTPPKPEPQPTPKPIAKSKPELEPDRDFFRRSCLPRELDWLPFLFTLSEASFDW
jgi:alpha-muurolene/germacrene-A/gamma-muurolene synthase